MGQLLPAVHVLVVDDSPELREALTVILEREGAVVTGAGTAERALDLLQRLRPDVLLSDLEMPDKDGFWLIGQVRALLPDQGGLTPAACITGSTGPGRPGATLAGGDPVPHPEAVRHGTPARCRRDPGSQTVGSTGATSLG